MARIVEQPQRIPVPGGKLIDEYVGRVATRTSSVSVAHMHAPAGWTEPAQQPDFDEITLVLQGEVLVDLHDGTTLRAVAGQAVLTDAGERVRYRVGADGAQYVAICLPAFAPDLANRDPE